MFLNLIPERAISVHKYFQHMLQNDLTPSATLGSPDLQDNPSSVANTSVFNIPLYSQIHPSIDRSGLRDSELKMGVGNAKERLHSGFLLCPASVRVDI